MKGMLKSLGDPFTRFLTPQVPGEHVVLLVLEVLSLLLVVVVVVIIT